MKKPKMLRLALPYFDAKELLAVKEVLDSGYLTQGPKVAEFEQTVKKYIGTRYAFAMSSATTALHLSLVALGIGHGDEVLVPDFTFPASANVVVQTGAKPVLVDIDLNTYTMNLEDTARKITKKTRAIMPVHTFGLSADMDPILKLARKHNLYVIEDAACALGATYYGKKCGSFGDTGCFSFHPRKAITTGEGGMITTNDKKLSERIALLRSHGGVRKEGRFVFYEAGFNYRMSDIQAAIGIVQLAKFGRILKKRLQLAKIMSAALEKTDGITVPFIPKWGDHTFQAYIVLLDKKINRDQVIQNMKSKDIETTLGTYALHDQPFFQKTYGYTKGSLINSHTAYTQTLALPLYMQMTTEMVKVITSALLKSI